jgi:glycine cleavage system H protein
MSSRPNRTPEPQTSVDNLHREWKNSTGSSLRKPPRAVAGQPCVWMQAGLIAYRLCDQAFDCEHCLLDAALRGRLGRVEGGAALDPGNARSGVCDDRLYAAGHTWVQRLDGDDGCRMGLDAFGAALLGRVSAVAWPATGPVLGPGVPVCEIDLGLGTVSVCAPIGGRVARRNEALRLEPALLIRAPYDEGWILEMAAVDRTELAGLDTPHAAKERINGDLRRFRWCLALRLLADLRADEGLEADGCLALTDLRQVVAGPDYLDLLRQFVH